APDLPIDRLPPQLQTKRFLRSTTLLLDLRALEFEARVIAIERLLERGDDNVGQACFDLPGEALSGGRRQRRFRLGTSRGVLETTRGIAKCNYRVVGPEEIGEIHQRGAFKRCSPRANSARRPENGAGPR